MEVGLIQNGAARISEAIDGGKAFAKELEQTQKEELIGGVFDILYGVSDGKLWNEGATFSIDLSPSGTPNTKMGNLFKEGTTIQFIPIISTAPENMTDSIQKTGAFIFSQKGNPKNVAAVYSATCYLTDDGHNRVKGSGRFMTQWETQPKEDSLLAGIALFGSSVINELQFPN
jgi:hypothetical protein